MKNREKYLVVVLGVMAGACTYDFPEERQPTMGVADFTQMISIGSGLTAGFMNGALYTEGQSNSFAAILAAQMKAVGGGDYNQPDVNSNYGCYNPDGGCSLGRLYLKTDPTKGPLPTPHEGDHGTSLAPVKDRGYLDNFGIPGFQLAQLVTPLTGGPAIPSNPAYNPYYARIASNPGTSLPIDDIAVVIANATFFTFWLGNDDVLEYAVHGGSAARPLTSEDDFNRYYNFALKTLLLAAPDAKGAVANIPEVTSLPHFTTIAWNPISLDDASATALTAQLADNYNAFLDGMAAKGVISVEEADMRKVFFTASVANAILINDETLTDLKPFMSGPYAGLKPYAMARQTTNVDLVCMSAGTYIGMDLGGGARNGVSVPLQNPANAYDGDDLILIPTEIAEVTARTAAFNSIISNAVTVNDGRLVLINAHEILKNLQATSTTVRGSAITASIQPPFGGFSLDGLHPNARGNGYLANKFIEAINAKFGSAIPECNPNDFAGNELPVE